MAEGLAGPSHPGTVLLDIGGDTGALVIYAPGEMAGEEIEVSPRHQAGARTHALVRERQAGGGCHAAVYPALPAGDYTIWRDRLTPADVVSVTGGEISQYRWPAAERRHPR